MANWVRVAAVSDCPPGKSLEVIVADRIVALFNVDGTLHAIDGVCRHQGGPLAEGSLDGTIVTCPWHGWQFDVCTGRNILSQTVVQPKYPVRVEGNDIQVDLEAN